MEPNVFIPTNYTDAGKILGLFYPRNALEAVTLGVPLTLLILLSSPFSLTVTIFLCVTVVVPVCGFCLFGIHDYSLFTFIRIYLIWR